MATRFSLNIVRAAQRVTVTGAFSPQTAAPSPGLPPCSVLRPITGLRRVRRGWTFRPPFPPPVFFPVPPPGSVQRPITSARRPRRGSASARQFLSAAAIAPQTASAQSLVVRSPRKPRNGRIFTPVIAPPVTTAFTLFTSLLIGDRSRVGRSRSGRVWFEPLPVLGVAVSLTPLNSARTVRGTRDIRARVRNGSINLPSFLKPPSPAVFLTPLNPVRQASSKWDIRYRQRSGRVILFSLPSSSSGGQVQYHIYANTGAGDPINYSVAIATTTSLSYTTSPLSYPGTWSFGVRAFDDYGEEQNLEAAVTIVLSATGADITNLPVAPIGLGAFATAGGSIRVQWTYPQVSAPARTPTGFHVYIAVAAGPLCSNSSARSARATRAYSGAVWLTKGVSSPGRSNRRSAGGQSWQSGMGGSPNYSSAVATVLYSSAIANSFAANLPGLMDGVTYTIGVRAYNSISEEPNVNTVSCTADASGPSAVDGLTAVASC
jgi:hypothetical protein